MNLTGASRDFLEWRRQNNPAATARKGWSEAAQRKGCLCRQLTVAQEAADAAEDPEVISICRRRVAALKRKLAGL
jgi:hypothetical protein